MEGAVGLGPGGLGSTGGAAAEMTILYHGSDIESVGAMVANQAINRAAARALGGGDIFWATRDLGVANIFAAANPAQGTPAVLGIRIPTAALSALKQSGAVAADQTGALMVKNWSAFNKAVSSFFQASGR
jgi:hypothetical protein